MTSKPVLTIALCVLGSTLGLGQGQAPLLPAAPANPPAPSLQAPADPGYAALTATCKTPPPARGRAGGAGAGARGAQPPPPQGLHGDRDPRCDRRRPAMEVPLA